MHVQVVAVCEEHAAVRPILHAKAKALKQRAMLSSMVSLVLTQADASASSLDAGPKDALARTPAQQNPEARLHKARALRVQMIEGAPPRSRSACSLTWLVHVHSKTFQSTKLPIASHVAFSMGKWSA